VPGGCSFAASWQAARRTRPPRSASGALGLQPGQLRAGCRVAAAVELFGSWACSPPAGARCPRRSWGDGAAAVTISGRPLHYPSGSRAPACRGLGRPAGRLERAATWWLELCEGGAVALRELGLQLAALLPSPAGERTAYARQARASRLIGPGAAGSLASHSKHQPVGPSALCGSGNLEVTRARSARAPRSLQDGTAGAGGTDLRPQTCRLLGTFLERAAWRDAFCASSWRLQLVGARLFGGAQKEASPCASGSFELRRAQCQLIQAEKRRVGHAPCPSSV